MPPSKSLTQISPFQGHVTYLRWFITNLSDKCWLFLALNKNDKKFEWDEHSQCEFKHMELYLANPPVVVSPNLRKTLTLYIVTIYTSIGAFLAQTNDEGKNAHYII